MFMANRRYASEELKREWLDPLLRGEIRSVFVMTEPEVASSDATNIRSRIERQGDHYIINGRKWWSSGAGDPRAKVMIFMGKTSLDTGRHEQQSMIVVRTDTPGITNLRSLNVFGYDDAPHGHSEVLFENVRVPVSNIRLGEGRGFKIAQGRLGPGRRNANYARCLTRTGRWVIPRNTSELIHGCVAVVGSMLR